MNFSLSRVRTPLLSVTVAAACLVPAIAAPGGAQPGPATQRGVQAQPRSALATAVSANPLANRPWRNYDGPGAELFPQWRAARGTERTLLGKITGTPRVRWLTAYHPPSQIYKVVRKSIETTQHGNPNTLVQLAIFRLLPREWEVRTHQMTNAEISAYKLWVYKAAQAIGRAHVALILQPDLAVYQNAKGGPRIPNALTTYAAQKFSAQPNTSVYIDGGAGDWLTPHQAAAMLIRGGVRYARGFALNTTHYSSTSSNVRQGAAIVRELARVGLGVKHFVVNTMNTGKPFTYGQYHAAGGRHFDNAGVCRSRASVRCVTLGIPPTWNTSARQWGLPADVNALAAKYADAYLWIGRSWLVNQSGAFDRQRALQMARTTQYSAGLG